MATFAWDSMDGYLWQNIADRSRSGGSRWNGHPLSFGTFRVFENRAYCEIAGVLVHDAVPGSADYAVQCTYRLKTDMGTNGVAGRISTSALNYYTAYYSGGNVVLARMLAGSLSVLGTAARPWVAGDHTLRLEMLGTTIAVLWDGVEAVSVTDSGITAKGFAGIRSGSPNDAHIGKHIDTFLATDDTTISAGRRSQVLIVGI